MAPCMLNYMTDISLISIVKEEDVELQIEGIYMLHILYIRDNHLEIHYIHKNCLLLLLSIIII